MKVRYIIALILILQAFTSSLASSIVNTKHNLSTSGTGTIKSTGEQEVCVFCHIPHNSRAGEAPLWNRTMHSDNYNMYNSDYLRRMNYPTPTALGTTAGTPGTLSRQCLSCHDGTVAVGSVYMVRGTLMGNTLLPMANVNLDGKMLSSSPGYIGTDLRGHHPVGIEYDHSISKNFGSGSRSIELLATPGAAIKLYTYNNKQYVECSSCHDPHIENGKFLRYTAGGSHGANVYGTCVSCHDKTNWTAGAHATATNVFADTTVDATYGTGSTIQSLGCVNCHKPHNGEGKPYLLRKVEENTCFQGAGSGTTSTVPCHGTGGAKDIQSVLGRNYSHPVTDITLQGNHSNLDVFYGFLVTSDGGTGVTWAANKHAECTDCHNPHQAKAGNHATPSDTINTYYPASPSNLVSSSGPLTGVTGVEPSWSSRWSQPTSFTTLESSEKEYQICMKCHSYWGLGVASNGLSSHFLSKHTGVYATDQAWEFNPYNRSAHPVVMTTNQMWDLSGRSTLVTAVGRHVGPLQATRMKSPWNTNVGNQTMYCSDCHGADNEVGTDPKGPHGSDKSYMLKGVGTYWPVAPGGALWNIDAAMTANPDLFCQNCHATQDVPIHQFKSSGAGFTNVVCVNCHVAVPHGSPLSRLMGYSNFPEPYNYGGNSLKLTQYKRIENVDPLLDFKRSNASYYPATSNCASGGSGTCHKSAITGYETVP